jgi:hypothetical protein
MVGQNTVGSENKNARIRVEQIFLLGIVGNKILGRVRPGLWETLEFKIGGNR